MQNVPTRRYSMPFALLALTIAPMLYGCAESQEHVEIVATPRVNPYSYLTFGKDDTPATVAQILKHNAIHARMKKKRG